MKLNVGFREGRGEVGFIGSGWRRELNERVEEL